MNGIKKMFAQVPETYELVNHVLTLGMDMLWRRKAARMAAQGGGTRWLDVCSGTGEMAVYLSRLSGDQTSVYATDFCAPMLNKARSKPDAKHISFAVGDTRALPFPDDSFDLVTISFATRNINVTSEHLADCLREFHRVLKPEGRFINLETSQPTCRVLKSLVHLYVRTFVAPSIDSR